ncbi:cysteine peptidase family C39 domain-containing protein [Photobacterium sp. 53610]|uniref:cysteine peptidase family C39 domain-containing protein n=1 Tax=Photobacterium sp. 53610 TaxID=3102789 RepID=UPI002EDA9B9E
MVATVDENGNDLGNLALTTGSLTFRDLKSTDYRQDMSGGITSSTGVNAGEIDSTYNSTTLRYLNTSSYSKDKTLATLGQGEISIADDSDLTALNRDTQNTSRDLFDVDRQQGNVDITLDHRLLTKDGWKEIQEDAETVNEVIGNVANTIGLNHVTQYLYDIDDPFISALMRDNAEKTLDTLIEQGVDPKVAKALLTNPEFYNTVGSILTNGELVEAGEGLEVQRFLNKPGEELDLLLTSERTSFQKVLLGFDEAQDFVSDLPVEQAEAAMLAMSLLTGGVVKTAIDLAKDAVVDTAIGDEIREFQHDVAKEIASSANHLDINSYEFMLDYENGEGFSTSLQEGAEFGLAVFGVGVGLGVAGKSGLGDQGDRPDLVHSEKQDIDGLDGIYVEESGSSLATGGIFSPSQPIDSSGELIRRKNDRGSIQIQPNGSVTCGQHSCGMVLNTKGDPVVVEDLIRTHPVTSSAGTTMPDLQRLLKDNGVSSVVRTRRKVSDLQKMTSNGRPSIVMVRSGPSTNHFVVVDGVTTRGGQRVVAIRDPAGKPNGGVYYESVESFENRFTGNVIQIRE